MQEHNRSSTNTETVDDTEFFGLGNESVGNMNRPKILRNILKDIEKNKAVKHRSSKQMATNSLLKNKQETEYLFRVEFDQSTGIPSSWIDTKTINYFNTLRENIFASSS